MAGAYCALSFRITFFLSPRLFRIFQQHGYRVSKTKATLLRTRNKRIELIKNAC